MAGTPARRSRRAALQSTLVDKVEEALRAQESVGWYVGDLIVTEKGSAVEKVEEYLRNDLAVRLEARGLDIEYERLRSYFRTALRNPPDVRNGVSFTAAEEAGERPERFNWYATYGAKLSKRQVRRLRGDRFLDGPNDGTTKQKAAALSRLLGDRAAVQEALGDPHLIEAVLASIQEDRTDARAVISGRVEVDQCLTHTEINEAFSLIIAKLGTIVTSLETTGLNDNWREIHLVRVKSVETAVAWVRTVLEGSVTSFDDQVSHLLWGDKGD